MTNGKYSDVRALICLLSVVFAVDTEVGVRAGRRGLY
ncbi:hypothetical protein MNBD_GAMMA11-1329 [hydrothermal vent metagenome]|uniref:Uncharacterized protein n=1 Tax=hydrothermal vent metagenome TaxID=652676 RepID=A0A3B0XJB0_9ZZZZ